MATKVSGYHYSDSVQVMTEKKLKGWGSYEIATRQVQHYDIDNFFHPWVDELAERLRRRGLSAMLSPEAQALSAAFFDQTYEVNADVRVHSEPAQIDESVSGPYAVYNWELFYHLPVTIGVQLSRAQRFAEAQRWFHLVFDPTSTDPVPGPARFWRFLRFRQPAKQDNIGELLALLATPDAELDAADLAAKTEVENGYAMMLTAPFHPHLVARTRPLAYQYSVVMKYLDNLIAWGDALFGQDTVESINEATQRYVMAANLLGPRPQRLPPLGRVRTRTYAQLKAAGLDVTGNAFVPLEGEFPLNLAPSGTGTEAPSPALFGLGRTLYFCVPDNDRLLTYWDTVADRLFKIRHCLNIAGVARQLALFDPPLDPGMLVKAAAAGIDVGAIVAGVNQPSGPQRCQPLLQKSLELAAEVKSLGAQVLGALEKADAEQMMLLRQTHERRVQQIAHDIRYLQWKNAEASTAALLRARQTTWARYAYYGRLLGVELDSLATELPAIERPALTAENFDEVYAGLVAVHDHETAGVDFPDLSRPSDPAASRDGDGSLFLTSAESSEIDGLRTAAGLRLAAGISEVVAGVLTFIPEFNVNLHFWGMGASSKVAGGSKLSDAVQIATKVLNTAAGFVSENANIAGKTAGLERRADDWIQQFNQAGHELSHFGRQIIGSLIAEQIARHEYLSVQQQITNTREVDDLLAAKFTRQELYAWMGSELSRQHAEWYRFSVDHARRAERAVKAQLRRPEVDAVSYIAFNHWDAGRKGLLAGEALYADVKRLELAYLDNNRRELELTRHVSLRQLDPLALLRLKTSGSATITIPEWLFDRDYPGHYLRRLRQVSVSTPSVVGPFTPLPLQLTLQRSSIRTSPLLADGGYARTGVEDVRFTDVFGPVDQIATSGGVQDTGMFEGGPDDRLLPFEGAGAISTWQLELPRKLRGFDYATISDVVLHLRYTARQGGALLGDTAVTELEDALADVATSELGALFHLRQDFPTEWAAFASGADPLRITLTHGLLPYLAQGRTVSVAPELELFAGDRKLLTRRAPTPAGLADGLNSPDGFSLELAPDATVLRRDGKDVYLIVRYGIGA